jgi:carbon starvation protein
MAFSTFVFDTLDVATRLGRYILQELSGRHDRASALLATAATTAVPLAILLASGPGAYRTFWTLFGTSNQLLAALTLLAVTVWLKRLGKRYWFTLAPMAFVLAITLWSLTGQAIQFLGAASAAQGGRLAAPLANAIVSGALFALTVLIAVEATRAVVRPRPPAAEPTR